MRLHRRFQRSLAAALAALALAAPSALATPAYDYHATDGTSAEEQYISSHGIGAPRLVEPPRSATPAVQPTDAGFDWSAAAAGAAAAAAIIALISLGAPRLRVRIAR
jgi:hypothetical protein